MRLLTLLFLLQSSCPLFADQSSTKPNFLLILADDMSYHDLGCYGNSEVKTPHLDQLAAQGTRFTRCYNSSPMCAPTRMSLYTGIHPVRNGGYPNHSAVHPHIKSLPHHLAQLGYTSALLGKQHYKPLSNFPFTHLGGRSHDNGKGLDLDLSKARTFFDQNKASPWCLVLASNQPHQPWNRGDASAYPPEKLTVPANLVDTPETRLGISKYYAEITYLDQQVGTVLRHLEESGQSKNTLVIFLSEQGSNFPFCKWTCYETGLRSAAIARWPGKIPANQSSDALVQYVDLTPTFVQLAGGDPTTLDLDGKLLTPLLQDTPIHQEIFGLQTSKGIFSGPDAFAIRTVCNTRFRLIWNLNHDTRFSNLVTKGMPAYHSWKAVNPTRYQAYLTRPEFELYDIQSDPWCLNNLATDPAQEKIKSQLLKSLKNWMKQQGDLGQKTEQEALTRMPSKN